jgi:hypothetical protein
MEVREYGPEKYLAQRQKIPHTAGNHFTFQLHEVMRSQASKQSILKYLHSIFRVKIIYLFKLKVPYFLYCIHNGMLY